MDEARQAPCPYGPESLVEESDDEQRSKHINGVLSDGDECGDKNETGECDCDQLPGP